MPSSKGLEPRWCALPSQDTLETLEGYNLLRTDQNGWVELTTVGKQAWVEVQRK